MRLKMPPLGLLLRARCPLIRLESGIGSSRFSGRDSCQQETRKRLRRQNLATGATARPTRTSWVQSSLRARYRPIRTSRILPDVILTLVHSTRLLPWVVKIMSVPRSVSRAIPRPPLAVQKVADNRLESLTTVAPYARRQQTRTASGLKGRVAGATRDERAWSPVDRHSVPCVPYVPYVPLCWQTLRCNFSASATYNE